MSQFGINCAPITTLAKLIALELFSEGELEVAGFSNQSDYDTNNPEFIKAITSHIQNYERALIECIERKDIAAEWLTRHIATGKIDPENTLISSDAFFSFLKIFDFPIGDRRLEGELGDFFDSEIALFSDTLDRVLSHRLSQSKPNEETIEEELKNISEDPERLKNLVIENLSLKLRALNQSNSQNNIEKPLAARERTTLLIIIAALAKAAKIDISKPGKAGEIISNIILELGIDVDHYTIEKKLKQIPDALERREKLKANPK